MGSWWVYEEETTHERDSMYVTESINDPDSYNFDMRIKSSLTNYEYHYWPFYAQGNSFCSQTSPNYAKCLYVKRSKGKLGDFVGENDCFFISYKLNDWIYGSNVTYWEDKIIVSNIIDSFNYNNLIFDKTIVIKELKNYLEGNQMTYHYFSKGVGITRFELIDSNKVWNLVNYYIAP